MAIVKKPKTPRKVPNYCEDMWVPLSPEDIFCLAWAIKLSVYSVVPKEVLLAKLAYIWHAKGLNEYYQCDPIDRLWATKPKPKARLNRLSESKSR